MDYIIIPINFRKLSNGRTESMLYQVITAAGLVTFALNLILNLRNLKASPSDSRILQPAPFVSVPIPARNKEVNTLLLEIN